MDWKEVQKELEQDHICPKCGTLNPYYGSGDGFICNGEEYSATPCGFVVEYDGSNLDELVWLDKSDESKKS